MPRPYAHSMEGAAATQLDPLHQRALGAWATPRWLVDHVLDQTLEPLLASRPSPEGLRILDPACGDGRFLDAAAVRLCRRYGLTIEEARRCLFGVEIDAEAAETARRRLGLGRGRLRTGDGLTVTWDAPFDVVVGNPPFLNQLAALTSRGGRSHLGGGPYADAAVEFLALAFRLVPPCGGRVGLVLPLSVLASRDAGAVRTAVARRAALCSLWLGHEPVFDAAVLTMALSFVTGARQASVRRWRGNRLEPLPSVDGSATMDGVTWSPLVADALGIPRVDPATRGTIGDLATATAGFRDQFYGLVPFVGEGHADAPLITSGLLDPGHCAWSERPARFAGRRYDRPGVDLDRLGAEAPTLSRWVRARRVPKVVVATQTRCWKPPSMRRARGCRACPSSRWNHAGPGTSGRWEPCCARRSAQPGRPRSTRAPGSGLPRSS